MPRSLMETITNLRPPFKIPEAVLTHTIFCSSCERLVIFFTGHANGPNDTATSEETDEKNRPIIVTSDPPAVVPCWGTIDEIVGVRDILAVKIEVPLAALSLAVTVVVWMGALHPRTSMSWMPYRSLPAARRRISILRDSCSFCDGATVILQGAPAHTVSPSRGFEQLCTRSKESRPPSPNCCSASSNHD